MLWLLMRVVGLLAWTLVLGLVLAPMAFAYIDPGSGSYIIQILAASLLGAAVAVGTFWKRIKAFFGKFFKKER